MNPSREYLQACSIQTGFQKEYIAGISRGELLPHLLFTTGSKDTKTITEHPAVLWKVLNVRNHLAKQSEKRMDR